MKRDHWTNEEVIYILEGFKNSNLRRHKDWNTALDMAVTQFFDFQRPVTDYAAMAFIPETQEIVVVGPPLPR